MYWHDHRLTDPNAVIPIALGITGSRDQQNDCEYDGERDVVGGPSQVPF